MWSPDQLDNLVAPIALYPDPLLGQMLVASTYPLEVVEASRWLQQNRNLRGQDLVEAAKGQPWDPSIQALVAVPDALAKLNQDIRWTTDLGNAFLAQQADVMGAVQQMRARAQGNGRLGSTPQQTVTTEDQGGQQAIVIEPASPDVIYVPSYDPYYIWGPPVYGFYPPLYYPGFGFFFGPGFDLGFCFAGWGGWGGWGWGPSWFGGSVFVNNNFFNRYGFHHGGGFGRTPWVHNPIHRTGVPYANSNVAGRFGGSLNSYRSGAAPAFAGRTGGQTATHRLRLSASKTKGISLLGNRTEQQHRNLSDSRANRGIRLRSSSDPRHGCLRHGCLRHGCLRHNSAAPAALGELVAGASAEAAAVAAVVDVIDDVPGPVGSRSADAHI